VGLQIFAKRFEFSKRFFCLNIKHFQKIKFKKTIKEPDIFRYRVLLLI